MAIPGEDGPGGGAGLFVGCVVSADVHPPDSTRRAHRGYRQGVSFEREPARERPDSPPAAYGVPPRGGAFVEWGHVVERLDRATAY